MQKYFRIKLKIIYIISECNNTKILEFVEKYVYIGPYLFITTKLKIMIKENKSKSFCGSKKNKYLIKYIPFYEYQYV